MAKLFFSFSFSLFFSLAGDLTDLGVDSWTYTVKHGLDCRESMNFYDSVLCFDILSLTRIDPRGQ